jgi:diaminohydroxyphosphoribosylaminopyrimidine deaminase / 5-amino-6-(5-phosphoribosylamino)uracil reductase
MTDSSVHSSKAATEDPRWMKRALALARRAYGLTSPNPMVGAVLVKKGRIIGEGYHHQAGLPHAEIEAIRDAVQRGHSPSEATLYVTLEPCSTYGRTPPCTEAIVAAGIGRVVVAATDPNPAHAGKGFDWLTAKGIPVAPGLLAEKAARLNEAFNHWIVHRQPWITVKAAMTLDGKIATATGESKWITGERSRAWSMKMRQGADAILVGVNTVIADDPQLTCRRSTAAAAHRLRRIVLDSRARTPLAARIVVDDPDKLTTIVVTQAAPQARVKALAKQTNVLVSPAENHRVDLDWLLSQLGKEQVTSLLVEGGGEVNAAFLLAGYAHRIAFFYAPKILAGRDALGAVGGAGATCLQDTLDLSEVAWKQLGPDLLLTAKVNPQSLGK